MKTLLFTLIFLQIAEISFSQCTSGDCNNGFGIHKFSNGIYKGQWRDGKRHGKGMYNYNGGSSFEGLWVNDQKFYGKFVFPDGTYTIGQYKNNERDGIFYETYLNGEACFGEFSNGEWNGFLWTFSSSGEVSFGEVNNSKYTVKEKAHLHKIDFELKEPEQFTYYVSKVDPIKPIPNDLEELDKNIQIQLLNSYFTELKKYQSNLKVDYDKELTFSKAKWTELENFINHAPDFNDLLNTINNRKEVQLDSMFNENKLIIVKLNAISHEIGYTASITRLQEKYEECNLKHEKIIDPLIGELAIVDVHNISTVSALTYGVIPSFKKNKKGQIEKLKWQIDSLNNQINILKLDHYIELNPILISIDVNLEYKDEIIDQRKTLFNNYACIRKKCFDVSDVLFKNKMELKKLEEYKTSITNQQNINIDQQSNHSINGIEVSKFPQVKIKNQIWMTQNLNVEKFRNGDVIPHALTNKEWVEAGKKGQPAWCYYKNDPSLGVKYGKLYNWYAVHDARGLAPLGWHIPTESEWKELSDSLNDLPYDHAHNNAGLKIKSTSDWKDDNGKANNSSGFSGLPSGFRNQNGEFYSIKLTTHWWSSSQSKNNVAGVSYGVSYGGGALNHYLQDKAIGYSVRCLKDITSGNISHSISNKSQVDVQGAQTKNTTIPTKITDQDTVFYWPNGKIEKYGQLINGKKQGKWTYYRQDGTLWTIAIFEDDLMNGSYQGFHENGTSLKYKGSFENGKREGSWNEYDENGKTIFSAFFIDGIDSKNIKKTCPVCKGMQLYNGKQCVYCHGYGTVD